MELGSRVAIITGGARGQGAAHARRFVAEGAAVIVADVLDDEGSALADELGAACVYEHLDVSNEATWNEVCERTVERFGGIDVLVNNAGIRPGPPPSLPELDLATFARALDVNLTGALLGMMHVATPMARRGGGAIVNVSSIMGERGSRDVSYGTSKWALRGLSKSCARLLAPDGTRVNAVLPGPVATDMVLGVSTLEDALQRNDARLLLKRLGEPEDVTEAVLFLASDRSSYLTGTDLVVDGGWLTT